MKKLIVSLFVIIVIQGAAKAQITKGTFLLGGSMNISTQKNYENSSNTTTTSLSLSPEIGYMLNDYLALGIGLSISGSIENTTYSTTNSESNTTNMIFPSLFVQAYYPIVPKLYWSLKGDVGLGWANYTSEYGSNRNSNRYKVAEVGISPELDYFLTPRIGIKTNFNGLKVASYFKNNDKYMDKTQFDLNPSSWSFGFFVKL